MKHNNVIAIYAHVVVVRTKNMTKLEAFFVKKTAMFSSTQLRLQCQCCQAPCNISEESIFTLRCGVSNVCMLFVMYAIGRVVLILIKCG